MSHSPFPEDRLEGLLGKPSDKQLSQALPSLCVTPGALGAIMLAAPFIWRVTRYLVGSSRAAQPAVLSLGHLAAHSELHTCYEFSPATQLADRGHGRDLDGGRLYPEPLQGAQTVRRHIGKQSQFMPEDRDEAAHIQAGVTCFPAATLLAC